jgi:hypothetical protein
MVLGQRTSAEIRSSAWQPLTPKSHSQDSQVFFEGRSQDHEWHYPASQIKEQVQRE